MALTVLTALDIAERLVSAGVTDKAADATVLLNLELSALGRLSESDRALVLGRLIELVKVLAYMAAERAGTTPREELEWAVGACREMLRELGHT